MPQTRVDNENSKFFEVTPKIAAVRVVGKNGEDVAGDTAYQDSIAGSLETLTVSGTAQQITATNKKGTISIRAAQTNTGIVYVGDISIDPITGNGIYLNPKDFYSFSIDDLSTIYWDSTVTGDKIHVIITYIA